MELIVVFLGPVLSVALAVWGISTDNLYLCVASLVCAFAAAIAITPKGPL